MKRQRQRDRDRETEEEEVKKETERNRKATVNKVEFLAVGYSIQNCFRAAVVIRLKSKSVCCPF